MTESTAALKSKHFAPERVQIERIVVGKDVLELLSSAMYVDPLTIYREYVQNAADSIDLAHEAGLYSAGEKGKVEIEIDAGERRVKIRDNGIGVRWQDFGQRL